VRRRSLAAVAALSAGVALLAGGCGGTRQTAAGGSGVVPKDTAAFVAIDTDTSSDQWKAAEALLGKFPDGSKLLAMIQGRLAKQHLDFQRDVKPALGPEVDVAVFDVDAAQPDVVLLTQPTDQSKLDALLAKSDKPLVKDEIGGWTAVAEKQATLDRLKEQAGNGTLDGSDRFNEATKDLDQGALVRFYVDGTQLGKAVQRAGSTAGVPFFGGTAQADWFSGTLEARDEGVLVHGTAKGTTAQTKTYKAELAAQVPADAVAYVSFSGLDQGLRQLRNTVGQSIPGFDQQIAQFEAAAQVSLDKDVLPLFAHEGAVFVTPASPIPAVTLALNVDDPAKALATVDKLVRFVGKPRTVDVAGVQAHEVPVQSKFRLLYAAFDGKLVLTSAEEGISGLRSRRAKLADDPTFQDAKSAAGMPDETGGFVYADVQGIAQIVYGFAAASGQQSSAEARRNLAPVKSFIAYGSQDGDTSSFTALLRIQ
jgi:hypothetical protein